MKNKLYILKCEGLKKIYKTHYFLCIGEKELAIRMRFNMKQFVNISSGTIVDAAIWKVGYDIQEVEPNTIQQEQIDKMLKKKSVLNFITKNNL